MWFVYSIARIFINTKNIETKSESQSSFVNTFIVISQRDRETEKGQRRHHSQVDSNSETKLQNKFKVNLIGILC